MSRVKGLIAIELLSSTSLCMQETATLQTAPCVKKPADKNAGAQEDNR